MLDICLSLMKWDGRKAGMLLADASAKTEKTKSVLHLLLLHMLI
jgi:hypothetical protein